MANLGAFLALYAFSRTWLRAFLDTVAWLLAVLADEAFRTRIWAVTDSMTLAFAIEAAHSSSLGRLVLLLGAGLTSMSKLICD